MQRLRSLNIVLKVRKMLPTTSKKLHETKDEISATYPLVIAMALKTEVGETRRAIKTLTRWTGASERTVQNWLAGVRGPSGPHLVALARHSDAVHSAYLSLTDRVGNSSQQLDQSVALLREAILLLTSKSGSPPSTGARRNSN